MLGDQAGPQGGDGLNQPALPFRIRTSAIKPTQSRAPIYSCCFPYVEASKPDVTKTKIMLFTHN